MPVYNEAYEHWLVRNKGEKERKAYLKLFEPQVEETHIPKLQIFKSCPLMPETIKACSYAKAGKDGKPPEDVAEFAGDDPYDTLRYACDSAERYFSESSNEFENVQRQQRLIETLKNTHDWTAFYRQMNTLESGQRKMLSVNNRFHKGRR